MIQDIYQKIREEKISGRYITNDDIFSLLENLDDRFTIDVIGTSVENKPIKSVTFGNGGKRILMWSQMHGNESTTTKAAIDLINFIKKDSRESRLYLSECTIKVIPILNPDGAKMYTRANANKVDLNRDAQNLSQPESVILRDVYTIFKPHYCFNLHDQRTIYNVGNSAKPATVSFLAPASDEQRSISESRKTSMLLIAGMNKKLQQLIPGQVGKYDDAFNANCVGDAFQMAKTPTVLFEAGHFPDDYRREKTRELIFIALEETLNSIANDTFLNNTVQEYDNIPENGRQFYDILIKNADHIDTTMQKSEGVGILYEEILEDGAIAFRPKIEKRGIDTATVFGHKVVDCTSKGDLNWLKENKILELVR